MQMEIVLPKKDPTKTATSTETSFLVLSHEGARDMQIMLAAMGHTMKIGEKKKERTVLEIHGWVLELEVGCLVRVYLTKDIQVCIHKDAIRGVFKSKPTE
jgi:hypothetical protein